MKWSFRIGRILGIDVFLHVTFVLLLLFIAGANWRAYGSLAAVASGVAFFLALFACVLMHEYGHALMARRFGIATHDITLLPIGGVARLERMPSRPLQELWVALAGPAVNVVIAAGLWLWLTVTATWEPFSSLSTTGGGFAERLLAVNIFLVLFNMIPAFPMDGGRVLRAVLALRLEYARATRIAATIGQVLACVLAVIGLFSNALLLFIAAFVWLGAGREASACEAKAAMGGMLVREAMLTDFRTLSPQETLADVVGLLIEGAQQDFPVTEGNRVVGVLTHERIFERLGTSGEETPVGDAMERTFRTLEPNERLDHAVAEVEDEPMTIPVLSGGCLVGLLTSDNIDERLMIRAAKARRALATQRPGESLLSRPAKPSVQRTNTL